MNFHLLLFHFRPDLKYETQLDEEGLRIGLFFEECEDFALTAPAHQFAMDFAVVMSISPSLKFSLERIVSNIFNKLETDHNIIMR